jgi:hypothetical protein
MGLRSSLRALGIAVAVISGAVAVVLLVFAHSTQSIRLGVVLALWAALIGSLSAVRVHEPSDQSEAPTPAPIEPAKSLALASPPPPPALPAPQIDVQALTSGMVLELRRSAELERQAAAAERKSFQLQLELMLRREIEHTMERQLRALREELADLRTEVMDQVGGQLRLERIETTRLFGSDVQALQREVRRLATVREALESSVDGDAESILAALSAEQSAPAAVLHEHEHAPQDNGDTAQLAARVIADSSQRESGSSQAPAMNGGHRAAEAASAADTVPAAVPAAEAAQAAVPTAVPMSTAAAPAAKPAVDSVEQAPATPVVEAPAAQPLPKPAATPAPLAARVIKPAADLFADLPSMARLTPLPKPNAPEPARYTGRRRRTGEEASAEAARASQGEPVAEVPAPRASVAARNEVPAPEEPGDSERGGQRRARAGSDDVLARLLGR